VTSKERFISLTPVLIVLENTDISQGDVWFVSFKINSDIWASNSSNWSVLLKLWLFCASLSNFEKWILIWLSITDGTVSSASFHFKSKSTIFDKLVATVSCLSSTSTHSEMFLNILRNAILCGVKGSSTVGRKICRRCFKTYFFVNLELEVFSQAICSNCKRLRSEIRKGVENPIETPSFWSLCVSKSIVVLGRVFCNWLACPLYPYICD